MTRAEFRAIKSDMTIGRVRRIVGANGRLSSTSEYSDGNGWKSFDFRQCGKSWDWSSISIDFEALDARLVVFRKWPTSTSAARLHKAASKAWPDFRDEVVSTLAASPSDAVLFAFLTLKEPEFAWNLAHSLALDSDHTWSELVKAYEKVDPIAVLPIHQRLVENELVDAGAHHYRLAARRLARMRKLSAGSEQSVEVNDLIADLREIHRRPPRLQQEFDRAGLP